MDAAIARLTELHELGVRLAVDNFGEGYASLNYVRRFPIDALKIGGSFVKGVTGTGESRALVAACCELASILDADSVGDARGDASTRCRALLELGCELGQGFLFGPPVPADEFLAALPANEGRRSA